MSEGRRPWSSAPCVGVLLLAVMAVVMSLVVSRSCRGGPLIGVDPGGVEKGSTCVEKRTKHAKSRPFLGISEALQLRS